MQEAISGRCSRSITPTLCLPSRPRARMAGASSRSGIELARYERSRARDRWRPPEATSHTLCTIAPVPQTSNDAEAAFVSVSRSNVRKGDIPGLLQRYATFVPVFLCLECLGVVEPRARMFRFVPAFQLDASRKCSLIKAGAVEVGCRMEKEGESVWGAVMRAPRSTGEGDG